MSIHMHSFSVVNLYSTLITRPPCNLSYLVYCNSFALSSITCQRVSAWQCCMGGVAFLWERVNFGPRQNKPSNRSRPTLASVITSQRSPNVPSLVDVTSPAAARRRGGLSRLCDFFPTFFFFFRRLAHSPDG
jgi:hypothetical protein